MRNHYLLLYISLALLTSCNNDSSIYSVGEDFIELDTRVIITDTLSVNASSIILDSITTSTSNRLLIGAFRDNDFGNLTSQSYLNLETTTYNIDNNAVYDSIGLILYYDKYYYGDTTQIQTIKAHEIIENFEPDNNGTAFYNTSSLKYDDTILGSLAFTPYPNKKDSIFIPLNNNFGKNLFEKLQDNDINNSDDLYQNFKGITLVPNDNNTAVLGFGKTSLVMRMYFTIENENDENTDYYNDFTIESAYKFFNKTTSDKSSTLLSSITSSEDILKSSVTNNKAYIQSGTSINMRIDIPYIKNLNALEQNGTVLSAALTFYPDIKTFESNTFGADSLIIYVVDKKNRFIQQLTNNEGSAVYAKYKSMNNEFDSQNYYTADITYFIEEIKASSFNLDYSLLFQFPNNNNTVNKIQIYDSENSESKMKVDLTYLLY